MDYIIILLIIFIIILLVIKTTTNNLFTPSVTKFQPTLIQPSNNSNKSVTYKLVNGIKTSKNNLFTPSVTKFQPTLIQPSNNSNNSVTYKLVNGIKTPITNNSVTYKLVNGIKTPIISDVTNNSVTYKLVNGVKTPIISIVSSGNTENKSGKNSTARQHSRYNKATLSDSSTGSTYSNRNASSASTSISSTPSTSSNKTKNINEVYNISLGASENSSNSCISKENDSIIHKEKDYYFLGDPRETQVYHIYNNIYTLKEAQEECSKRTSTLATSEQLDNAYSNGADWCSWGWANDGNAYLPNKNKKCNSKIGLLNGKKIDPFLRMGINCYGVPK